MLAKYKVIALNNSWGVAMTANDYIVEVFDSEEGANLALIEFENGRRFVEKKMDVWIVDDSFVCEPEVGGILIGEVHQLDINQFNVVNEISQDEFDQAVEAYFHEHGCYPDT